MCVCVVAVIRLPCVVVSPLVPARGMTPLSTCGKTNTDDEDVFYEASYSEHRLRDGEELRQ